MGPGGKALLGSSPEENGALLAGHGDCTPKGGFGLSGGAGPVSEHLAAQALRLRLVEAFSGRFKIGEGLAGCGEGVLGATGSDLGLREESHEEGMQHPGSGCPNPGDALHDDCEARIPFALL